MNEKQYNEAVKRTMNDELDKAGKLAMLGMGLAGEAGEITDYFKKVIFQGHKVDRQHIVKELGDLEWYREHVKNEFNITDAEIRETNIKKLQERYPEGFTTKDSLERKDEDG